MTPNQPLHKYRNSPDINIEMDLDMALQDDIRNEITEGRLQPQWTTADLLANTHLAATYEVSTLRTDPPNRSVSYPELGLGDGFHVRNGATSIFVRVGRRGRALLYALG